MHQLGATRSAHRRDHLLQTPDTFVRTPLPGLTGGNAIVHTAPAAGAAFTQYTLELAPGGVFNAPTPAQRFLYVIEGAARLNTADITHDLHAEGYAYIPPSLEHTIEATEPSRLIIFEKPYSPLPGVQPPALLAGDATTIPPVPLQGDLDLQVCQLLPDSPQFDFAINLMTYAPGASLSQVEIHVMEHGVLMLQGGGIYRLGDAWYPTSAGDFIYMAPFCPQWFGALGKEPARYILYKDTHRHPLS